MIRDFSPCTSRGYEFTVSKENTIKINTGDYLYETDLTGALLNKKEISDCTYDELNEINKHRFVTSEGSEYVMKNVLLRTHIFRLEGTQKTAVYKMPFFDYAVKLVFIGCWVSMMIVIPVFVVKTRRKHRCSAGSKTGVIEIRK